VKPVSWWPLRHWPLKLAALALAVILWIVVQAQETTSQLVTVDLRISVPPTLALVAPAPPVRALVSGPGRELIKLYATPPVIEAELPATAGVPRHLLAVVPSDVRVPRNAKVVIQDVEPREIALDLDRVIRRTVPVALRAVVEAESGFAISGPLRVLPSEVRVSGPRSLVNAIDSILTEPIEVRGVTAAFERTVPLDTARRPLVAVSPREVVLTGRVRRS
jgi:hypothetical protein